MKTFPLETRAAFLSLPQEILPHRDECSAMGGGVHAN